MKRYLLPVLVVLMVAVLLTACGAGTETPSQTAAPQAEDVQTDGEMPVVVNTGEYTLYRNIFYNDGKADFAGKEAVKEGTFTVLHDAFNDVTRYYVWGYNDQTKCCDWQWELKMDDTSDLPAIGSLVKVTGTYEENEAALDKFWIIHPQITVEKPFSARDFEIDMQAMSDTLERVQTRNIVGNPDVFEGKTVCGYGRIRNEKTLEDPYYNDSWTIEFSGDFTLPAFGTMVAISGTVQSGSIANCTLAPTTQY